MQVATVTANYNNEKYIKDCMKCILRQSRKPDICVVIDDGSSARSWEVIAEDSFGLPKNKSHHEIECDGIRFLLLQLEKNSGVSNARNIALQYLSDKTDVVFVADADDEYYPKKIEKSLDVMERFPEVCLVYSDYDTENVAAKTITREYKEVYSF